MPLEAEARAVAEGKKLALLVAGAAVQAKGEAIQDEQEVLGAVSDMITDLYLAESAVLRAQKAALGAGRWALKDGPTQRPAPSAQRGSEATLFVNDMIGRLEARTRDVMARVAVGDELRAGLAGLRRFTRWTPLDTVSLRRQIAAETLAREGY
jgi:hypothetical protein